MHEHYRIDYCDRWRHDANGRPKLTLRKLYVLISQLPPTSRLARALSDDMYWSLEAQLLDDVRMSLTGSKEHPPQPHPQRPTGKKRRHQPRQEVIADARRRSRERERMIASGEIT